MRGKLANLSIYQRLALLAASIVVLLVVAYTVAIKETLEKKAMLDNVQASNAQQIDYPAQIQGYHNAIHKLDSLFKQDSVQTSIRNKILQFSEAYSDTTDVEIIHFQESSQSKQDNYTLIYNTLCLKGSFKNLIRFYHAFENLEGSNKLISLNFYLKKEKYQKDKALYCEGLIQIILHNEK